MNLEEARAKLDRLRHLDSGFEYFGSKVHRYTLFPPLPVQSIRAVESKHCCELPTDYRACISELGNGGAGPSYGLYPLETHHVGRALVTWGSTGVGDLSKPFPHTGPWNLPKEFWAQKPDPDETTPLEEEDRMNEEWDRKLESQDYWLDSRMDGAIPVSDLGCARQQWLAITGPEAGCIWEDLRVDYEGIVPLLNEKGEKVTFAQWYLSWLNKGISKFDK